MKRYLLILFLLACIKNSYSQTYEAQVSNTSNSIRDIYFVNANTGWAVGENGTVLKTTNGGSEWIQQPIGNNAWFSVGCYFVNDMTGWVVGESIHKTTDGGATWDTKSMPYSCTKVFFINETIGWAVGGVDGSSPYTGAIFKTTDAGANWSQQINSTSWCRFYGVQFVNENVGWVYTERTGLLLKTTDGGENWQTQLNYRDSVNIRGMYFLDENNGWVAGYSSNSSVLLNTTDGGNSWKDYGIGLQYGCGSAYFINENVGYAAGNGGPAGRGLLKTTDGGATWNFYPVTGNPHLNGIFFLNENLGWAYGENGAIYKYTGTTAGTETISNHIPDRFSMEQNYPNPFNPATIINYKISSPGFVNLKIYDILGNEAAVLINEYKSAGSYSVKFDGSNLSSGVYFYSISAGSFHQVRKMMLLR